MGRLVTLQVSVIETDDKAFEGKTNDTEMLSLNDWDREWQKVLKKSIVEDTFSPQALHMADTMSQSLAKKIGVSPRRLEIVGFE